MMNCFLPEGESPLLCARCARGHGFRRVRPCLVPDCECWCQRGGVVTPRLALQTLLVGHTIVEVDLRPFPDGRGAIVYDPILTLSSGARVSFSVRETEDGSYGLQLIFHTPESSHAPEVPT